jgi:hypothetical protein
MPPPIVDLLHRRFQPRLDQLQEMPIADAPGHRSHQLGVGDAVEVAGQVRVDDVRMPRTEQPVDLPDGIQGAAFGSIGVLLRLKVGLEDRLQDQHHGHLRHAVSNRPDPQRSCFALRFGDGDPPHGLWLVRLLSQVFGQFVQPALDAVGLDVRRAVVGTAAVEGEFQDVATVHLVVQQVEAIAGRSLRFGMQRLLEFPNLRWRCEAHANLLVLTPLRTLVLNSGPFPPPELPGFLGTTSLSVTPVGPACPSRASGWESRAPTDGVSRVAVVLRMSACRRHYPGGTPGSCRFSGCNPHSPSGCGLPRFTGGSASTLNLSRPARRSLALRPADSPSRCDDPFSRRLRRFRCLHRRSDSFRLERRS